MYRLLSLFLSTLVFGASYIYDDFNTWITDQPTFIYLDEIISSSDYRVYCIVLLYMKFYTCTIFNFAVLHKLNDMIEELEREVKPDQVDAETAPNSVEASTAKDCANKHDRLIKTIRNC